MRAAQSWSRHGKLLDLNYGQGVGGAKPPAVGRIGTAAGCPCKINSVKYVPCISFLGTNLRIQQEILLKYLLISNMRNTYRTLKNNKQTCVLYLLGGSCGSRVCSRGAGVPNISSSPSWAEAWSCSFGDFHGSASTFLLSITLAFPWLSVHRHFTHIMKPSFISWCFPPYHRIALSLSLRQSVLIYH